MSLGTLSLLLITGAGISPVWTVSSSGQVGLGGMRTLTEHAWESKPITRVPLWSLLQFLSWIPAVMECDLEVSAEIDPFLPSYCGHGVNHSNRKQTRMAFFPYCFLDLLMKNHSETWARKTSLGAKSILTECKKALACGHHVGFLLPSLTSFHNSLISHLLLWVCFKTRVWSCSPLSVWKANKVYKLNKPGQPPKIVIPGGEQTSSCGLPAQHQRLANTLVRSSTFVLS